MPAQEDMLDRAFAALAAGAIGDALGMPTQLLNPAEIAAHYGFVDRFVAPTDDHPVSRGLAAGTITDDTEQTLLLARRLIGSPQDFDHAGWVAALVEWERDVKARGSYDLLGPSTKRALDAINEGVAPAEAGRFGTTNGAAMRIAPVGIMMPDAPLEALVEKVAETCRATHNTPRAIAGASAVAAAVSHGVAGGDWQAARAVALDAAALGAAHGHADGGPDMRERIAEALRLVEGKGVGEAVQVIASEIGTGVASEESVPAAFAVVEVARGDPWQAAVLAANLGGDTDTIGAIAAGMAGASAGSAALPEGKLDALYGFDIAEARALAGELLRLRLARADGREAA